MLLGVTNPTNPKLETAEGIRDQLVRAARFIPAELLGSTDDCGFSPYLIDEKPRHGSPDFARDVAFAKIAARVRGTALASTELAGAAAAEPLSYAGYGATGQAVPRAATPHQGPAAGSVAAEDSVPGSGTAPHPAGGAA
ncbi:hypothetical protein [Leucobacter luti]|uniref:hypothetical protein n=1 Tax=Leucobacter luti TaxID=340320 RepID=UPI00215D6C8A|nr:hypothetical protein [Leucobacter luti]